MTDLDWGLLCRYAAGACTPEERESFEGWLEAAPEHRRLFEWARTALVDSDRTIAPERKAEMLAALKDLAGVRNGEVAAPMARSAPVRQQAASGAASGTTSPPTFVLPRRAPPWRSLALAAGVMVAIGAGLAGVVLVGPDGADAAPEAAVHIAATPRGQRTSLHLSDGTRVMLGPASRLYYPLTFGAEGPRKVVLEGEAFFEVVHDDRRPFVVRAADLVATDLGTAFLVRAHPEDPGAEVVVREGKVGLRPAAGPDTSAGRVVSPGELGRLDGGGVFVTQRVDTAAYFAWTGGRLVFRRTPLREVLPELGRWYDVEFRVADPSLNTIELSGVFKEQLTDEALKLLAVSLGIRYERQGKIITLYPADGTR